MNAGRPGSSYIGLVNGRHVGQSQFMWSVRGNPNVKKVFRHVWDSDELVVSFDGAGCFRDWHRNAAWKTTGGWYHCDQVRNSLSHFVFSIYALSLSNDGRTRSESLTDAPSKVSCR